MNARDTSPRDATARAGPGRTVSRRRLLRGTGMGAVTIAVAGTGAASYRAYDNRVLGAAEGEAFDAWRHWRDDPGPRGMVAARCWPPARTTPSPGSSTSTGPGST